MLTKEEEFSKCDPAWVEIYNYDFSQDPLVLQRAEEAKAILKKIGLPEEARIAAGLPENWQELL